MPDHIRHLFTHLAAGLYYLALGLWLGLIASLAVVPAVTFREVREAKPVLRDGPYATPGLQDQHAEILAGNIVGHTVQFITYAGAICLITAALALAVRYVLIWCGSPAKTTRRGLGLAGSIRAILLVALLALLAYQAAVVNPAIFEYREVMYDTQRPAAQREQARAAFDTYHEQSTTLGQTLLITLALAVTLSPLADAPAPRFQALTSATLH